jgi:hypothetical protein
VASRGHAIPFTRIRCDFRQPVLIDEPVRFEYRQRNDGGIRLSALVDELICAEVRLDHLKGAEIDRGSPKPIQPDADLEALREPLDLGARELTAFNGAISNALAADVAAVFPDLCAALGASSVSALARLSYVVGMLCPGLHSVFSFLDVMWPPTARLRGSPGSGSPPWTIASGSCSSRSAAISPARPRRSRGLRCSASRRPSR